MNKTLMTLCGVVLLCSCSASKIETISIVPYPNDIKPGNGTFHLGGGQIVCDASADEYTRGAVVQFAGQLAKISAVEYPVAFTAELPSAGIRFIVEPSLEAESYILDISKSGIEAKASSFPGFLYAIQSLKQLLPAEIYGNTPAPDKEWAVPCLKIKDAPRFGYRGMHLDVARHFFTVDEVKRYLDIMAVHKLNVLHWHLTDDQGWRIEIKRYPELTTIGSVRKKTMILKEWGNYDHTPHGGYYTQDEIRDVVEYAAALAITVIPEIDLPGHMLAALTAYPHLGCTGGPYEVWGQWGVADDVLCPGNEEIFPFIENVLEEVVELFPAPYIHIGGDECPKVRWEKCPKCQARIKELGIEGDEEFTAEHYLQNYVTARVEKFLAGHGRRIIGWDEVQEGMSDSDAVIMSWRGTEHGITAAKAGRDVIMVPTSHFYFDYYQSLDQKNEPFGIGGYVPIEKVYSFDPTPGELTAGERSHIIGVQANIWTEYIAEMEHLEYMLLPRLAALSEVQWCNPGVRDWNRFMSGFRMGDIYAAMGYNFAKHIYGVTGSYEVDTVRKCLTVTLSSQGNAPIYYTLDGSHPNPSSGTLYTEPVEISTACTLRAMAARENMEAPGYSQEFRFSKSSLRPVTLNSEPTPRYTFGGALSLVDGVYGRPGYTTGPWVGFHLQPLDVTIDMEGSGPYEKVEVESLADRIEWVFHPASIIVYTSEDGVEFTEAASRDIPHLQEDPNDDIRTFAVSFPQTTARYLRVVAEPIASIPEWHGASGEKAHMFVSEIAVE